MSQLETIYLPPIRLSFNNEDYYLNLNADNDDDLVLKYPVQSSGIITVDNTPDVDQPPFFVVYVTDYCNMACSYCFNSFSLESAMHSEPIYKPSDFVEFVRRINVECFRVRFFGGEPLLNLPWMQRFVAKLKEENLTCDYEVFTNASLIDERFISFAKENRVKVFTSVNGGNDEYKGKKYINEIDAALRKLCDAKLNPYGRMVFSAKSETSLVELVKHPIDLGMKMISFTLPWGLSCERDDLFRIQQEVKEFSDFYISQVLSGNFRYIGVHPIIGYITKWILREKYYRDQCGAGKSVACISTSGDIFPCHCFNNREHYKCGSIYSTYEQLFENVSTKDLSACKNCNLRFICKSRCFADNYFKWQDHLSTNTDKCPSEELMLAASAYILFELLKHPSEYHVFKKIIQLQRNRYDNN